MNLRDFWPQFEPGDYYRIDDREAPSGVWGFKTLEGVHPVEWTPSGAFKTVPWADWTVIPAKPRLVRFDETFGVEPWYDAEPWLYDLGQITMNGPEDRRQAFERLTARFVHDRVLDNAGAYGRFQFLADKTEALVAFASARIEGARRILAATIACLPDKEAAEMVAAANLRHVTKWMAWVHDDAPASGWGAAVVKAASAADVRARLETLVETNRLSVPGATPSTLDEWAVAVERLPLLVRREMETRALGAQRNLWQLTLLNMMLSADNAGAEIPAVAPYQSVLRRHSTGRWFWEGSTHDLARVLVDRRVKSLLNGDAFKTGGGLVRAFKELIRLRSGNWASVTREVTRLSEDDEGVQSVDADPAHDERVKQLIAALGEDQLAALEPPPDRPRGRPRALRK